MPKPMSLLAPAILAIVVPALAAGIAASVAEAATDDCISKPNSTAPQGQHWYYRIERPSKRRCWYLGAEGGAVRTAAPSRRTQASRSVSAKLRPSVKPDAPARIGLEQVAQAAAATPVEPAEAPIEAAPTGPRDTETGFATRWSHLTAMAASPALAPAVEAELAQARARVSSARPTDHTDERAGGGRDRDSIYREHQLRTSYAEERTTMHSEDDMPLIWPVLSAADRQPVAQPNITQLLLWLVGGALCIIAMFGFMIFRLSFVRPRWGRHVSKRWASGTAICRRQRIPPTCAQVIAARSHAERVSELIAAMRRAGRAQPTLAPSQAPHGIEDWRRRHDRRRLAA